MPALDRLARESIVFDQAVTVAPVTLPSHASLLTGLYPPRHGVRDNHLYMLGADVPTFAEALAARGYATAAFVSAPVVNHRFGLARGFSTYDDETGELERSGADTLRVAEKWLAAAREPAFVWIHLFEPHAPYKTGTYDSEVTAVDTALGAFLDRLRAGPRWARTVVSVTSDHGESLGDHGERTHGFFVYDSTLLVPWVLRVPGRRATHVPHQVRLVDVMPTVAELAGAPVLTDRGLDGISLVNTIASGKAPALEAYSETFLPRHQFGWSELRALRTERQKYIAAPTREVYDLAADRNETRNLAASRPDVVASMDRQLAALERSTRTANIERKRGTRNPEPGTDPELAEQFMALGYIAPSGDLADHDGVRADPKDKIHVYQLTMDALEQSEKGRAAEALQLLAQAERLDPNVAQVAFLRGVVLGNVGRFAEATRALERAIQISPRHVLARFKLALAYLRTGRSGEAEKVLQAVLDEEPDNVRAMHNLAAIAYTRGDLDRAAALEQQAVARDANYAEAWNTLGAIHILRKQPEKAAEALQRATTLDPRNAQAFRNFSMALRGIGDDWGANLAARRACELDRSLCPAR